ncbi:MAG: EVE domain-containing protein [Candidatus Thiodiazotropha sp.]
MNSGGKRERPRFWIGVASRQHVLLGVSGGFAQLCHGKAQPLKRMAKGDWIVYYSPQEVLGEKRPCQRFTALGEVVGDRVYQVEMSPGFEPFRRDIRYQPIQETAIRPVLDQLAFTKHRRHWGYVFRFGHLQIAEADFHLIAESMSELN